MRRRGIPFLGALTLIGPLLLSCGEPTLKDVSISSGPTIDDPQAEMAKFEDFSLFYVTEKGGYLVGDYKGPLSSIVVPDQATGEDGLTAPIIGLADNAFKGRTAIKTVLLGENILSIGDYAFRDSGVTDLRIAGCLSYVGENAFENSKITFYKKEIEKRTIDYLPSWTDPYYIPFCNGSDQRVLLDSSCPSVIIKRGSSKIENEAFKGLSKLKCITIPSSVTSVGKSAFYGCSSLTSLEISEGVASIGQDAFALCSSLESLTLPFLGGSKTANQTLEYLFGELNPASLKSVTLLDGCTSIGFRAFNGCKSLTSISIPRSVVTIEQMAFNACSSLAEVSLPESLASIGEGAFSYCSSLASINIPSNVSSIGDTAFSSCTSLVSLEIPSKVDYIGQYAFWECASLSSVIIPSSVDYIGAQAFANCPSLTIYCRAKSKPQFWDSSWNSGCPVVWGYTD